MLSMACIAGKVTPSPSPSIILTAVNMPTPVLAAAGVSSVRIEVIRTPKIIKVIFSMASKPINMRWIRTGSKSFYEYKNIQS